MESQQLIMASIAYHWPSLSMVGEEDCEIPKDLLQTNPSLIGRKDLIDLSKVPEPFRAAEMDQVCVFIDPLDATKGNLTRG